MASLLLSYCKGPGGYVEVWQDYDDATGVWLQTRIVAEPGARLRAIERPPGRRPVEHGRGSRAVTAPPGKIYVPGQPPPWPPMELSS